MYKEVVDEVLKSPYGIRSAFDGLPKRSAFPREERKKQIIAALTLAVMRGEEWSTLLDIANTMKVSASTKLRDMCTELLLEDAIDVCEQAYPGVAGKRRFYRVKDNRVGNAILRMQSRVNIRKRPKPTDMELLF